MLRLLKRNIVWLSILLYCFLFLVTYNWYRFCFDVDGIGPMMIARRVANHDWLNSVNGVWSPLNAWIASLFPGIADEPVFVFKLINAFCSAGIIYVVHSLVKKLLPVNTNRQHLLIAGIFASLPVILLSHTHYQLSGDLLQLLIVLIYIRLVITPGFIRSLSKNIIAGVLIALASYAKAYNFPFLFGSHLVICILANLASEPASSRRFAAITRPLLLTYSTALLLMLPWVVLLHQKYKIWTFSTVQKFNFHWLLNEQSYSTLKSSDLLMSPPYPDSPTAWEDPYSLYASFTGPFDSLDSFLHFLKNILHNFKVLLTNLNELSFLTISILLCYVLKLLLKKEWAYHYAVLFFMSIFLFVGYLLIYIELRYVWLTGLIALLLGAVLLAQHSHRIRSNLFFATTVLIFCASFLLTPVDKLQDMRNEGRDIEETAAFLKANLLSGKFTMISTDAASGSWSDNLAFVTGNQYYRIVRPDFTEEQLLHSIEVNGIEFVLQFYKTPFEQQLLERSLLAKKAVSMHYLPGKNYVIFKLRNR
jgi:hypothetical protein